MRTGSLLASTCISLALLAGACRDDEPSPTPPVPPPPEIPPAPGAQQSSGAQPGQTGQSAQPAPTAGSADVATGPTSTKTQDGSQLFAAYCITCHGTSGAGDGPMAATIEPKPRNFQAGDFKFDTDGDGKTGTEKDLTNVIQNGAARYGGSPLMTPFSTFSAPQIQALARHVQSLKKDSTAGD
jgi:mono/diheme cytochrome c family protein